MPHLQYLILAECYTPDLSALATLKELKWLELFMNTSMDITPLAECTALEDLNICYMHVPGAQLVETLSKMPWLKRLWCCGTMMNLDEIAQLRAALPDTEIWYAAGGESTGSTWRYSESYYDMRDAFHMYYMDYRGNSTQRLSSQELEAIHRKFWGW